VTRTYGSWSPGSAGDRRFGEFYAPDWRAFTGDLASGDATGGVTRAQRTRDDKRRKAKRFRYWDKGTMATIGRNKAVADLRFLHLSGRLAWLSWLFVHIVFLVGFRNACLSLSMGLAYLTFDKGARLITRNFQSEQSRPHSENVMLRKAKHL